MKNISKLNDKGFVLAETIIVAAFVIALITFLFMVVLPLIGEYEKRDNYDDLNSKYEIHLVRKMLLRDESVTNVLNLGSNDYVIYNDIAEFCHNLDQKNYCFTLLGPSYLNVKSIIMTTYKVTALKEAIKTDPDLYNDRATVEYIKFIPEYSSKPSRYNNYNRIILKYEDGRYANIEVIYENA